MAARAADERGSALVLALFVMTLLTGMGTALLFLSQHEARMSQAALREKKAFYLAEAGLEHARMALYAASPDGEFEAALAEAKGADTLLDFDPDAINVGYDSSEAVVGFGGYADDTPLAPFTALSALDGRGWYTAFLTNDPGDGVANPADPNGRVMITAIGAGEDRSVEIVQAIVEAQRLLPPPPAAAITMLGPLPTFYDDADPGAPAHTGDDCGVAGGAFAPIVGTVSDEATAAVAAALNQPSHFTANDDPPFVGPATVANLTSLIDPIVVEAGHPVADPVWTDCTALKQLVADLVARADHYCNADDGPCSLPSTPAADTIVVVDGDLAGTPGGSYTGTLVVTGELTWSGATLWEGLVLAIGEGRMIRSGGGSGRPSGGLVVANIDPSPNGPAADRSDWCSEGVDGFEPAFYDTSSPGNAPAVWCSSLIEAANPIRTYRVSQFLQR